MNTAMRSAHIMEVQARLLREPASVALGVAGTGGKMAETAGGRLGTTP